MSDYQYLPVSDGSGNAGLMHITALRSPGSTTIQVDTVSAVPTDFIAASGTLAASGLIDPTTLTEFKGHLSGSDLEIDGFEPGSTDVGHTEGQVVIIKPTSGWANRVAQFIKNMTGSGTPEVLSAAAFTVAAITATSLSTSADVTVGGSTHVTGNIDITGTSRLVSASVVTADGSNNLTPTKQLFDVTALAHSATILTPTFSPFDGMTGELQILDNGSAQGLTWNSNWVPIGVTLPNTTVAGKYLYISYRYNAVDTKWHVLGIARQS